MTKILNKLFLGGDWKISLSDGNSFRMIPSKKGFWYADPFLFEFNGITYIFVEAFEKRKEIGRIGFLSSDSNYEDLNILISNEYHYSFPNVFSFTDDVYMIPESSEENNVCIYKFDSFPTNISKKRILLSGDYVDTALVKKEDDYYIFATYDNTEKKLLFFKYYFLSEMTILLNTIADCNSVLRPAGNSFIRNGITIMPFQYCTEKYGEKIVLKQVVFKKEQILVEKDIEEINSNSFNFIKKTGRIHTFNSIHGRYVVDYMNDKIVPLKVLHMVRRKIRRKKHKKGI